MPPQALPSSAAAPVSGWRTYLRLLTWMRPYWGMFALSLLGFLIFSSAQPMLAGILKYFVDGLENPEAALFSGMGVEWLNALPLLHAVPLLIILIALWQGLGTFVGNFFLARVTLGVVRDLRRALFNHLLLLPNHYFDHENSGHLISRITYNVTMVTEAITDAIKIVIREGLTVILLFSYLLWMNGKLTLVMLAILPVITVMARIASRKFRRHSHRIQEAAGELTHVVSETIQSYRVVRSFGGEAYESRRFEKANENSRSRQLRVVRTSAIYTPLLQITIYTALSALMFLVLLLRGDASSGDLVAYITAAGLLPKPIRQISEVSSKIQRGIAGAQTVFAQLDEAPERDAGTLELPRAEGRLEARNVAFAYPGTDRDVLSGVSFVMEPGQMTALVGRSGSGKSTLASLIPRFYTRGAGEILLDGIPIEALSLKNLRRHIALVTQQVTLFNDSLANNIAYGDLAGCSRAAVRQAAEDAFLLEFIDQLPEGMDTLIGENGVMLSGGQRQRVAIARALLKDAPLLILDEATSALDTESERHIQAALEKLTAKRTTLVIAHRLSTIERADQILVMDAGKIIERGAHAELLAKGGTYARLHAMQFAAEA
ncbi:MAG: lipid A export permease/ATP-binding protein MsbA [Zoogloeaceae bacterium]|jgi:subfamily B ATP-binding cassette protein MsbA|nr:lipid A export permease/ATP-binding protein MsbA [Zoogloeaceae bacterium]